jgi:hypothetical protein
MDDWSQLIIKRCEDSIVRLTEAPPSGVYTLEAGGSAKFRFAQHHRRTVEEDDEAFFLRIPRAGDRVGFADDLGTLVFRGRAMTADGDLTDRARAWIRAIRAGFAGAAV